MSNWIPQNTNNAPQNKKISEANCSPKKSDCELIFLYVCIVKILNAIKHMAAIAIKGQFKDTLTMAFESVIIGTSPDNFLPVTHRNRSYNSDTASH